MHTFSVARYRVIPQPPDEEFYGSVDVAVPVIDGTPLFTMLGVRYPGLPVQWVAPPSRQWLGDAGYSEEGRAVLLDGTCGHAGCCGVFARISLRSDAVVWSDFFARGHPELPPGLYFEFPREPYEKAMAEILHLQPTDWTMDLDDYDEES